jgi:hypothetical protein
MRVEPETAATGKASTIRHLPRTTKRGVHAGRPSTSIETLPGSQKVRSTLIATGVMVF